MARTLSSVDMERLIRRYFAACNSGRRTEIADCFVPDAIHYFPPGMYEGPFKGASTIGAKWEEAVRTIGSRWTVDRILCNPDQQEAVAEWTHFKTRLGSMLRGAEWYVFDAQGGLIKEIRAYYASPQAPHITKQELEGLDYEALGYATVPPPPPALV